MSSAVLVRSTDDGGFRQWVDRRTWDLNIGLIVRLVDLGAKPLHSTKSHISSLPCIVSYMEIHGLDLMLIGS